DETRRKQLIDRLREVYRGQGIEVPNHILEEGVRALEERRFVYDPPQASLSVMLARLYVARSTLGRWIGGGLLAIALVGIGWQAFVVRPRAERETAARIELTETLPRDLNSLYATFEKEAKAPAVLEQAKKVRDAGLASTSAGQTEGARNAAQELRILQQEMRLTYNIKIISRPGESSGLWRIPKVNPDARNYYLIVEAVDERGAVIERPILNEETGQREPVKKWATRVSKAVFEAMQADKRNDGIIQNAVIGVKSSGEIDPRWTVDVQGGALTQW
ncbi:MAG: hypothetical protein H7X92_02745, partial [Chitinophagales bacterium]|nr:hypothetical protein [Hyphomicrobiales bacterium]